MIDWKKKLSSRKFWLSVACFASGVIVIATGNGELANSISGSIMSLGSVFGYLLAEGLVDSNK